jgi:hypothetical protein
MRFQLVVHDRLLRVVLRWGLPFLPLLFLRLVLCKRGGKLLLLSAVPPEEKCYGREQKDAHSYANANSCCGARRQTRISVAAWCTQFGVW